MHYWLRGLILLNYLQRMCLSVENILVQRNNAVIREQKIQVLQCLCKPKCLLRVIQWRICRIHITNTNIAPACNLTMLLISTKKLPAPGQSLETALIISTNTQLTNPGTSGHASAATNKILTLQFQGAEYCMLPQH